MNLTEYDEAKLAESRERVAHEMPPLRRTALPGTIKTLDHSVILTADDNLSMLSLDAPQIIMLDDATLHRACKSISPDDAHILRFAARNPYITSVVVVTDALSRCYWSPDTENSGDARMWAKAFQLDPNSPLTPDALFRLSSSVEFPVTKGVPVLKDENVMSMLTNPKSVFATSYESLSLFDKLESINDIGSFYMRTDRLLRERFLHNGEVVIFSDASPTNGGTISGTISSPCKLRVAKPLVVMMGNEMFNTEITTMSYRKGRGLVGTITSTGRGLSTRNLMEKSTTYLTAKSYGGFSPLQSLTIRERTAIYEVPLDVILAALGDDEGSTS